MGPRAAEGRCGLDCDVFSWNVFNSSLLPLQSLGRVLGFPFFWMRHSRPPQVWRPCLGFCCFLFIRTVIFSGHLLWDLPSQALVHPLLPSSPCCVALLLCGVPGSGDVRGCSEVSHSFSPSVLPGSRASLVSLSPVCRTSAQSMPASSVDFEIVL